MATDSANVRTLGGAQSLRGAPWLTLAAIGLGLAMVSLNGTAVVTALPTIARDLHARFSQLQWVSDTYLLALAATLIIGGKLGDRFGRRRVFMSGVVGFAASSVGCSLVGTIGGLIALRGVQGLFGAMLLPNTVALMRAAFAPSELNTAFGVWGAVSAVFVSAGPIIGGLLVEHASWHWVFWVNLPVAVAALTLGAVVLAESHEPGKPRLDLVGALTLAAALSTSILGLIQAESWGWSSSRTWALLIGGLVLVGVFVIAESRVHVPLVPLFLFRSRALSTGCGLLICVFVALFGMSFYATLYLQNVRGYSAVQAGVRLLPLASLFLISAPLGGWINKRFGTRYGARVGVVPAMLLVAAGVFRVSQLTPSSSYNQLWPSLVALGLGIGVVTVTCSNEIVSHAPLANAGIAGGITNTSSQFGSVLGISLLGSLLATRVSSSLPNQLVRAGLSARQADHLAAEGPVSDFARLGLGPPQAGHSANYASALTTAAHHAFVSGFDLAMVVAGVICVGAAALGLLLRHEPDHPSTVTARPVLTDR